MIGNSNAVTINTATMVDVLQHYLNEKVFQGGIKISGIDWSRDINWTRIYFVRGCEPPLKDSNILSLSQASIVEAMECYFNGRVLRFSEVVMVEEEGTYRINIIKEEKEL